GGGGGGKPDGIFLAGFLLAARKRLAARVLPAFAGIVPMETKLRKIGAYSFGGRFGKGDPDPFANYFGKLVLLGHPAAEFFEDLFNRKFPVEIAFGKIDVRFDVARGLSLLGCRFRFRSLRSAVL